MNHSEYKKKRNAFAMSDAPLEARVKAITELDAKYIASRDVIEKARKQIEESKADINDIGGHD
jgi:hypothetical protein